MGEAVTKMQVVVLAAGHGKRMGISELPKVLVPFRGKPLITHLLESIKASGVCEKPVIVVGERAEQVKEALGPAHTYVYQAERLGTGHAVASARVELEGKAENIMVLYGDMPLVSAHTITALTLKHLRSRSVITMAAASVPDFDDWREGFYDFSRVLRASDGRVLGTIEKRDASPEQLAIREINPCFLCFRAEWLWGNLQRLKNNNSQKEYYLTDLIKVACAEEKEVTTLTVDVREALGVNTTTQLSAMTQIV